MVRQEAAAAWLRRARTRSCSKPNTLDYWFQVQSNGQIVSATYTGVVPDTFKSDSEVVLKGTLSSEGFTVQPNGVMAKCPSKYEAKPGSATPSGKY